MEEKRKTTENLCFSLGECEKEKDTICICFPLPEL